MNYGIFAGRIGRDAELKSIPSGKEVCEFSLAVDVGWGERKTTLWVKCAVWGDRGRKLEPMLTKGKPVTVVGRIKPNAYTSKSNELRAEIICDVQEVTLHGGGRQSDGDEGHEPATVGASAGEKELDDDIPF